MLVEVVAAPFRCMLAGVTVKDGKVALSACDAQSNGEPRPARCASGRTFDARMPPKS